MKTTDYTNQKEANGLKLTDLHLPEAVVRCYADSGIERLFDWQAECLNLVLRKDGSANRNLVYSAPTSAGKTLVAEVLVLERILASRKRHKALFVLPFVSVAKEKLFSLQKIYRGAGVRVEGFMGALNPLGGLDQWDVGVCTIEKANSLLNRLLLAQQQPKQRQHATLGDSNRGATLELFLTKLLYASEMITQQPIQIVGMSATVSNLADLARWLGAHCYTTDFRPVPLTEMLAVDGRLFTPTVFTQSDIGDANQRMPTAIRPLTPHCRLRDDKEGVAGFCLETVLEGCGVLVFCSSKAWCEQQSLAIAKSFRAVVKSSGDISLRLRSVLTVENHKEFLDEFARISSGVVDPTLVKTLPFMVAFHHAGLTGEEREQLEWGFRRGFVRVVVATSTLSAGVNLPARRVIVRAPWGDPKKGPDSYFLSESAYRQMIGRAGRKGIDPFGESILMCRRNELKRGVQLAIAGLRPVQSAVGGNPKAFLKRALLEALVGGLLRGRSEARRFVSLTLLATLDNSSGDGNDTCIESVLDSVLQFLIAHRFVTRLEGDINKSEEIVDSWTLGATQLGAAAVASALAPDEATAVFGDLDTASRGISLDTELHLVYLVTPISVGRDGWASGLGGAGREETSMWPVFYELWCQLSAKFKRVAEMIGVSERFIVIQAHQQTSVNRTSDAHRKSEAVHIRFYTALVLHDVISEIPVATIAQKFSCSRGFVQSLQQLAATYAGMVVTFCDRLGWYYMKTLLEGFAQRIAFGIGRDLTDLVQIEGVDGSRARAFSSRDVGTVADLAECSLADIERLLGHAVPFSASGEASLTDAHRRCRPWLAGMPEMTLEEASAFLYEGALRAANLNRQKFQRFRNDEEAISDGDDRRQRKRSLGGEGNVQREKENRVGVVETPKRLRTETRLGAGNSEQSSNKRPLALTPNAAECTETVTTIDDDDVKSMNDRSNSPTFDSPIVNLSNASDEKLKFQNRRSVKTVASASDFDVLCDVIGEAGNVAIGLSDSTNASTSGVIVVDQCHLHLIPELNRFDVKRLNTLLANRKPHQRLLFADWLATMRQASSCGLSAIHDVVDSVDCVKTASWLLSLDDKDSGDLLNGIRGGFEKMPDTPKGRTDLTALLQQTLNAVRLMSVLKQRLRSCSLLAIYQGVYLPSLPLLARIESRGVTIDLPLCLKIRRILEERSIRLETSAEQIAERPIRMGSSVEIAKVLFTKLGLPPEGDPNSPVRKPASAQSSVPSTGRDVLEKLSRFHPFPAVVLEWRKIHFALTTALTPLCQTLEGEGGKWKETTDRLRCIQPRFQPFTATGRVSSYRLNVMRLPKDFEVIATDDQPVNVSLRSVVRPRNDAVLCAVSLCQLELRLLGCLSGDRRLIGILNDTDDDSGDVYTRIAQAFLHDAAQKNSPRRAGVVNADGTISSAYRNQVKLTCRCIMQGLGVKPLAEQLSVEAHTASQLLQAFREAFVGVHRFLMESLERCRKRGWTLTLLGRRIPIGHIDNRSNAQLRAAAERQCICALIQGSSADVLRVLLQCVCVRALDADSACVLLRDGVLVESTGDGDHVDVDGITNDLETQLGQLTHLDHRSRVHLVRFRPRVRSGRTWAECTKNSPDRVV